jgi:urease accessory protein UreH
VDHARAALRPLIADRRGTSEVGRTARLELVFAVLGGQTRLTHAYAEPPFRVARAFSEGASAHMILASTSPGIFGGDDLSQHIRVEPGARVRLTSQSALQVHPSASPQPARLRSTFEVAAGATLCAEWDPLIPFAGSRLSQRIDVRLDEGAALYWSDAMMGGREGRGERWAFASLEHELRLWRGGSLDYLERFGLAPGVSPIAGDWAAGDACYFGTVLRSGVEPDPEVLQELHARFSGSAVAAGVDHLDRRLALVRLAAGDGARFHDARAAVRRGLCPLTAL